MTKKKHIYSFDIFDTCFVRTCGNATNVFYLLAEKILGKNVSPSLINDFVLIRKKSEENARKNLINKQKEEITLNEIYRFCDFKDITEIDNDYIMQKELEVEDEVLLPIYETRKEIERLYNSGNIIMYISDMYLPKDFIIKKLNDLNFCYDEKYIYVSSDVNKTKENGTLYRHIQKKHNFELKYWMHTGDNKLSDYIIPQKIGIKAKWVKHDYNIYEKKGFNLSMEDETISNSYVFSLSRALRLTYQGTPQNKFAADFIAPIFVPYTYYILCDAEKRGIEHLYFIARDGYILYLIAKTISAKFPHTELHYLYASRKSLYLPGIEQISYDTIKGIVPHDKGIQGILYALQMEDFDYSHLPIKDLSCPDILRTLLNDKNFIEKITEKHLEQKELCAKYFSQEGLTNHNCAIVDVLGSRRCQKYMNNILRSFHLPEVYAYYYEVTHQRIMGSGNYTSINFQEKSIRLNTYHHVSQPLCEQYFCITNQQRTVGYQNIDSIIKPIFEKDPINNSYKETIFNANKQILQKYAEHFIKHPTSNPLLCIKTAQSCLNIFYHNPLKDYLEAFNGFFCTDGNSKYILLQKKTLLYTILHHNKFFRWKEGNLIYNSGVLYRIIRVILNIKLFRIINK